MICIVDDERSIRITVADELRERGYEVREFAEPAAALSMIREMAFSVVITDIRMPGMDGLEFIKRAKAIRPNLDFLVMTAYGSIQNVVEAMRLGAYNYLTKPFEMEELFLSLERIVERTELKKDIEVLTQQASEKYDFSALIGESPQISKMLELVKLIVDNNTSILIQGETGTGKELLTNIIHYNSSRKSKPLVKVSCALLSRDVFESELFGHEKGSFTGAEETRIGRFESAKGGTILLDDIDDMPLVLQVKILRVLEESELERVGGNETIKVDVRIITTTKFDLKKLVDAGKFRKDLYYRLNVFPIGIPPLRSRDGDVILLAKHFVNKYASGNLLRIEDCVLSHLVKYNFPGNVRELKNAMERAVLLAGKSGVIKMEHLPIEIRFKSAITVCTPLGEKSLPEILAEHEISAIKLALDKSGHNQSKAAQLLGIPLSTLRTKMEKFLIR